jgi:hypothetical protein
VQTKMDGPGAIEVYDDRPGRFDHLKFVRAKYKFALQKCQARRWKDDSVLRVTKSRWERQLLWALAKMDLLHSEKRKLAVEAVKVGVYKILYGCQYRHNRQRRYSKNGGVFKNKK